VNPNADFDTDNASWDLNLSGLADFEAELSDLLDPDHFETEVPIDDQGNFLNWSDHEARLVSQPMPSRDAPLLAPASSDLLGFSEKGGFGLSPTKTSSPLEEINSKLKLDNTPIEMKRGESLGMDDDLEAASLDLDDLMESVKPSASGFNTTGFNAAGFNNAPAAVTSGLAPDDFSAGVPMMDLFDAIEPRPAKAVPPEVNSPATSDLEPTLEAVTLPEPTVELTAPVEAPLPASVSAAAPAPAPAPVPTVVTRLDPVVSSVPVMPAVTTLRRHFDATDLLEAQNKLVEVLAMPRVPLVIFLGRAAERCSSQLPNVNSIALAELRDEGLVSVHHLSANDSFRKLLLEINESSVETAADLTIADLSDLELDEVVLPVSGPHLLLTKLEADPGKPGRVRGTLSLSGPVGLRSGAAFLKAVVIRLESPITLML
jgi:hypothetical protein